jgi:hypothetical protein
MAAALTAFGFNCSLKSSKDSERSSTDVLLRQFFDALSRQRAGHANHGGRPQLRYQGYGNFF